MATRTQARADRRQRHDDARARLCAAARELVVEESFADVTIDDIARAAGFSRSAFYFYFADKQELLMAMTAEVADALYREADRWWHGEGERERLVHDALSGIAAVYARHAKLLRVVLEVSSYDAEVREFWRTVVARFVTATAAQLRREGTGLDPQGTAEALVWMIERCCHVYLAREERRPEDVVEALVPVWLRVLGSGPSAG